MDGWTIHGIERGIKLPLVVLSNGIGEKVICHLQLLQFQPPQVGVAESLAKILTAEKATMASFLLVVSPAETIRETLWASNRW
jgi:hypothetical protein